MNYSKMQRNILFSVGLLTAMFSSSMPAKASEPAFFWSPLWDWSSEALIESESSIHTEEAQLVHVTSDAMQGYADLKILLDSSYTPVGLRYITDKNKISDFSPAQLQKGAVIYSKSNKDIIKVKTKDLDFQNGGSVDLIYLSNGITGSYEVFPMELVRMGNHWVLETNDQSGRRPFSQIFLKANKILGKVIGIDEVIVK